MPDENTTLVSGVIVALFAAGRSHGAADISDTAAVSAPLQPAPQASPRDADGRHTLLATTRRWRALQSLRSGGPVDLAAPHRILGAGVNHYSYVDDDPVNESYRWQATKRMR